MPVAPRTGCLFKSARTAPLRDVLPTRLRGDARAKSNERACVQVPYVRVHTRNVNNPACSKFPQCKCLDMSFQVPLFMLCFCVFFVFCFCLEKAGEARHGDRFEPVTTPRVRGAGGSVGVRNINKKQKLLKY